jgi:hypothetical protein
MNQVSGMKIREVTVLGIHDYGEVSPISPWSASSIPRPCGS